MGSVLLIISPTAQNLPHYFWEMVGKRQKICCWKPAISTTVCKNSAHQGDKDVDWQLLFKHLVWRESLPSYVQVLFGINQRLRIEDVDSPLVAVRPVKKVLLVVITGDRGLCGGYNNFIIKKVSRFSAPPIYMFLQRVFSVQQMLPAETQPMDPLSRKSDESLGQPVPAL